MESTTVLGWTSNVFWLLLNKILSFKSEKECSFHRKNHLCISGFYLSKLISLWCKWDTSVFIIKYLKNWVKKTILSKNPISYNFVWEIHSEIWRTIWFSDYYIDALPKSAIITDFPWRCNSLSSTKQGWLLPTSNQSKIIYLCKSTHWRSWFLYTMHRDTDRKKLAKKLTFLVYLMSNFFYQNDYSFGFFHHGPNSKVQKCRRFELKTTDFNHCIGKLIVQKILKNAIKFFLSRYSNTYSIVTSSSASSIKFSLKADSSFKPFVLILAQTIGCPKTPGEAMYDDFFQFLNSYFSENTGLVSSIKTSTENCSFVGEIFVVKLFFFCIRVLVAQKGKKCY